MTAPTPSQQAEPIGRQKREAAASAVEWVESGMVVKLGAGTSAATAIRRIAEFSRQGQLRDIVGIPCWNEVAEHGPFLGMVTHLPIARDNDVQHLTRER